MSDLPTATADLQSASTTDAASTEITAAEPLRARRPRGRGRRGGQRTAAVQAAAASSPNSPAASSGRQVPARAPTARRGVQAAAADRQSGHGSPRVPRSHPLLEQLAQRYPALFGAELRPLKRGIFEDLLERHGQEWTQDELKAALAVHTRSTRYLSAVASGLARHDLAGQPVEAMAPQHVHHALLEVFKRRQQRSSEDLQPKLRRRLVQAYEASGLTREDYVLLVRHKDEAVNQLLDEALAEAALQAARDEALLRAFESSGQSVAEFALSYGRDARQVQRTLDSARRRRPGQS
jgi:ProP effector